MIMFARISRALDLSADQQGAVKSVLRNHADEIAAQMTASRAARRAQEAGVRRGDRARAAPLLPRRPAC